MDHFPGAIFFFREAVKTAGKDILEGVWKSVNIHRSKVMMCTRMVDDKMMNVVLNGKLLEEVKYFEYLALRIAVDGGMNE